MRLFFSRNLDASLAGQRIVVTGATSGIGREIALQLAIEHGANVVATGRREYLLDELQTEARSLGVEIETYALDITDDESLERFCGYLQQDGVQAVVLNAGVTFAAPFVSGSFDNDKHLLETNVIANTKMTRLLLGALSQNQQPGRLMLVASLGGLMPVPFQAVYSGTKAFVVNWGLALREELRPLNISVSVFAPGGVATEMTDTEAFGRLRVNLAPAKEVAEKAITALVHRSALSVPGMGNKWMVAVSNFLPKALVANFVGRIYKDIAP